MSPPYKRNEHGEPDTSIPNPLDMVHLSKLDGIERPPQVLPFWEADIVAKIASRWSGIQYQVSLPGSMYYYIYIKGIRTGGVG
jgi:hypothetical protein